VTAPGAAIKKNPSGPPIDGDPEEPSVNREACRVFSVVGGVSVADRS
jgi:hypothetical protein